ncbi:MAG TPA: DUF4998 domain-containing protein [Parapedobacter sp.]|uniref:DUF4998 domain-containing protein n=1 Tax=Parapedobacter sp. TaxID=1958893 RepID=UPI002C223930|nr:DUF4998 domain-containing protein [Parapedobacter sp.]HWK56826.1 DUF4998 domain-containing protein [Parapedobacter sp.]
MMYRIIYLVVLAGTFLSACSGMYDSLEEYSGEVVYPAKYDTIVGRIGYERVEINLMKAGRIPSNKIKLGKAKKTVVEYDDQRIVIDSLVSWVNVTDLTQPKLYRFRIYTVDEFDNRSVAQEIALIPYTASDASGLAINSPRVLASPTSAAVDWPNGLSSVLLDYKGLSFSYTNKDGETLNGSREADSRFFVANLPAGQPATISLTYKVVPKVNNVPILDTVLVEKPLVIDMPTGSSIFTPVERAILEANGVTTFTADGVAAFTKLVFPIHVNSLQDIFYFSSLKQLDLTGGDLFEMATLQYDRNGAQSTVGGGDFPPFVRNVGNVSAANAQTLKDLLETGILEHVRYIPHSLGLDDILRPYVESGVVELVNLPDEALMPMKLLMDGVIQDGAWRMEVMRNPGDAPAGDGLANVLKTTMIARNASFVFALPTQYRYNFEEYRYLKFKVYMPEKSVLEAHNASWYQRLWPRFLNHLWGFDHESVYGQEYWAPNPDNFRINDADLSKWHDVTVDLSEAVNRHNRVIIMNIGGEPPVPFDPDSRIIYYFANFRLSKSS